VGLICTPQHVGVQWPSAQPFNMHDMKHIGFTLVKFSNSPRVLTMHHCRSKCERPRTQFKFNERDSKQCREFNSFSLHPLDHFDMGTLLASKEALKSRGLEANLTAEEIEVFFPQVWPMSL